MPLVRALPEVQGRRPYEGRSPTLPFYGYGEAEPRPTSGGGATMNGVNGDEQTVAVTN